MSAIRKGGSPVRTRTGAFAIVSILACMPGRVVASGGMAWQATITTSDGGAETMRVLSAPQSFKIQRQDKTDYLVRLDRGEIYLIDPKKRTYQKVKLAELESAAKTARDQMQAAWRHMQKELASLPVEQRQWVEQLIGERAAAAGRPQVRKTGQTKTIAGYTCTEYIAEVDGKTLLTACTTEQISAFAALRQDWLKVQQRLGKLNPFGGGDLHNVYGEIPGFPLETRMSGIHAIVTKVETTAPAPSEFEVPRGFELRPGPPLLR